MTKVINMYGGPGLGKSTNAAHVFALAKENGVNCEYVSEYVKGWAWQHRVPVSLDQFLFFGKQSHRETILFGKVDLILTDSPLYISAYYAKVFGTEAQRNCFEQMAATYYQMCTDVGVEHHHLWLKRVKPYNPKGRFQSEEEAKAIDVDMQDYLQSLGVKFHYCDGTRRKSADKVAEMLGVTFIDE